MIFIIFAGFFAMSVNGLPQFHEKRISFRDEHSVSDYFKNAIADMSQYMKDRGFDPLYLDKFDRRYMLPIPVIFNSAFIIEDFVSNGMSNIVVNSVSYNTSSSNLNFDLELPLVNFSVGAVSAANTIFGDTYKINSSGKVEIQRMRLIGQIYMDVRSGTGITIRSTNVKFCMQGIESNVRLFVQEADYSNKLNKFLNSTVPANLKKYSFEINDFLGILITDYGNHYLREQRN